MITEIWKLPKSERVAIQNRIADLKLKIEDRENSVKWAQDILRFHQLELERLRKDLAKLERDFE